MSFEPSATTQRSGSWPSARTSATPSRPDRTPLLTTIRRPLWALISTSDSPISANAARSSSSEPTVIESPTIATASTSMNVSADVGGAAPTLPATTTSDAGGADDA